MDFISTADQLRAYGGILEGYQTTLAAFLALNGGEQLAETLLLDALQFQSGCLGESAILTCTTIECLANLYLEAMDLEKAETFIKRLTNIEDQVHKSEHSSLLDTLLLSGQLQMRTGELKKAIETFLKCTEFYANANGTSCLGVAYSLASGAEILLMQGKVEGAAQNLYDARCIIEQLSDGSRCLSIRIKWDLARLSAVLEDYVRATSQYRDLIEDYRKHYGPRYRRWNILHCELGDIYRELGDNKKAEDCYLAGSATVSRRNRSLRIDSCDIPQGLLYASFLEIRAVITAA
jgi:tetratricopeptide (TPR) repeat protein